MKHLALILAALLALAVPASAQQPVPVPFSGLAPATLPLSSANGVVVYQNNIARGATLANVATAVAQPSLANDRIWVGNSLSVATAVLMSGDATLANTGAITVTKSNGVAFGALSFITPGTGVATALGNTAGGSGGFALQSGLGAYLPLAGGTMSGNIAMGGGNISGGGTFTATTLAGTLSTAAQTSVTSLGTLTAFNTSAASPTLSNSGFANCGALTTVSNIIGCGAAGTGNALFGTATGNVANHIVTMANTTVGVQDSGTLLSSLAPLASPSFTTPSLGVATATTINGVTVPSATDTTALLGKASQALSGGFLITDGNDGTKSSGTYTPVCGAGQQRYITNGGAFTLAAPAASSNCYVQITNNGSAGAVTFSGFTVGTNTGAALDTTNGHLFLVSIVRLNGTSMYSIFAYQ